VLAAVEFGGELGPDAVEVEDVAGDWDLAAKLEALELAAAKNVSQAALGVGHF